MKKILEAIMAFLKKLFRSPQNHRVAVIEDRLAKDRDLAAKLEMEAQPKTWQERHPRRRGRWGMFHNVYRNGPNMPRRQPCPQGCGEKKRTGKTDLGAYYWCNACRNHFFVAAS